MEIVFRAASVYFFLYLLFRFTGKRSLSRATTFDFVLLLIIAQTTQQALLGYDYSVTNAFVLISTLLGIDIGLSLWKRFLRERNRLVDGTPLIIVEDGRYLEERMHKARIDKEDVLAAARERSGLERIDQVKYAVLERHGVISIIPKS